MDLQAFTNQLKEQIGKVIIGKEDVVELIVNALVNEGHILLESVPGTGKTMLAKSIAKSIDGDFKRIQFTPDVLPSDVTGIHFFNPKDQQFELRVGPVLTNVLLADEINRATPRTQSSLLEVMEEKQVTIDGTTVPIEQPFIVIATQNPIESQQGTFDLPEAQMDRFFMKIDLGYPTFNEEQTIMKAYKTANPIDELVSMISKEQIIQYQKTVKHIYLSDEIEKYLLSVIHATRESDDTQIGVSPRGTLVLMRAVQACAAIDGRDYVIPEDVKKMAPYVLAHRLVLTLEASTKKSQREVMEDVLKTVEVPVELGVER
ncbi:AAA family ATPase [Tenuibacillus multivorans]|uniref:MoxR-like ATPase n=1 Tax=Tenuibacillus multivorans TaxID=237069 RepID=A0A1H0GBB2_9BACI|nr:MoxR family ATPase [Tenuibacillus multivorans]GEL78804.1 magnesium chelatase [Tenuibacillus multivorans]SDO04059.1 MoxR-like ATPase [Tenuibacillus multivorans]